MYNLLESIKLIVKFLVNHRGGYPTIYALNDDFYNYAGRCIPFLELGYPDLLAFLNSIPDVLQVDFYTKEIQCLPNAKSTPTSHQNHCQFASYIDTTPFGQRCECGEVIQMHAENVWQRRSLPWASSDLFLPKRTFQNIFRPPISRQPTEVFNNDCQPIKVNISSVLGRRDEGDGKYSSPEAASNEPIVTLKPTEVSNMEDGSNKGAIASVKNSTSTSCTKEPLATRKPREYSSRDVGLKKATIRSVPNSRGPNPNVMGQPNDCYDSTVSLLEYGVEVNLKMIQDDDKRKYSYINEPLAVGKPKEISSTDYAKKGPISLNVSCPRHTDEKFSSSSTKEYSKTDVGKKKVTFCSVPNSRGTNPIVSRQPNDCYDSTVSLVEYDVEVNLKVIQNGKRKYSYTNEPLAIGKPTEICSTDDAKKGPYSSVTNTNLNVSRPRHYTDEQYSLSSTKEPLVKSRECPKTDVGIKKVTFFRASNSCGTNPNVLAQPNDCYDSTISLVQNSVENNPKVIRDDINRKYCFINEPLVSWKYGEISEIGNQEKMGPIFSLKDSTDQNVDFLHLRHNGVGKFNSPEANINDPLATREPIQFSKTDIQSNKATISSVENYNKTDSSVLSQPNDSYRRINFSRECENNTLHVLKQTEVSKMNVKPDKVRISSVVKNVKGCSIETSNNEKRLELNVVTRATTKSEVTIEKAYEDKELFTPLNLLKISTQPDYLDYNRNDIIYNTNDHQAASDEARDKLESSNTDNENHLIDSFREAIFNSSTDFNGFKLNLTPPPANESAMASSIKGLGQNDSDCDNDFKNPNDWRKKNRRSVSHDVAIPFLDDDDPIQIIGSHFYNPKYGSKYETTALGTKMEVGRFYELQISEVNSPYKFWFQLDDDSRLFDELHENLNYFYDLANNNSFEENIDVSHMVKGFACAALYGRQWHRAEFIEKPTKHSVKLYFVDYGTVDVVPITDVRYLLASFCSTPKLCFRGTLDFIKPINHRWDYEATSYFIDLVENTKLVAGVSEIDCKMNSARIYVMDRENNINVNYKLVTDGYAFPDDPRERYKLHIADAVPTFDALESGIFPSLDEAFLLLEEGFDAEKLFEVSIIDDIDCYIPSHFSAEEAMQRVKTFHEDRENAKKLASQKDATIFLEFFRNILNNPFLNGISKKIDQNASKNPFSE